jgi:hypothetical protein
MAKINQSVLILQVGIGLILVGIVMFIIYLFTSPWGNEILYGKEEFQSKKDTILKEKPESPTNEQKNILVQYYTYCVKTLVEIFNVPHENFQIEFHNIVNNKNEIFKPSLNITQNTPTCMTKNCRRFIKNMTNKNAMEMVHKIGYYKMATSFYKDIEKMKKPLDKLELYETPGIFDRYNISNERNITQWGYIPTLIDKYLRLYTFFPDEPEGINLSNQENTEEKEETSGQIGIDPIPIPNDINIYEILTIDEILDDKNPHSIYELKRQLDFFECALHKKLENIFDDSVNCDTLKVNLENKVFSLGNDTMVLKKN